MEVRALEIAGAIVMMCIASDGQAADFSEKRSGRVAEREFASDVEAIKQWREDPVNWKLEVRPNKGEDSLSDGVAVKIITRNVSKVPRWLLFEYPTIEYYVELAEAGGAKIQPNPEYANSMHLKGWAGSHGAKKLLPGAHHEDTFELSKYFAIPKSGLYSVRVTRYLSRSDLMSAKLGAPPARRLQSAPAYIQIVKQGKKDPLRTGGPRLKVRR